MRFINLIYTPGASVAAGLLVFLLILLATRRSQVAQTGETLTLPAAVTRRHLLLRRIEIGGSCLVLLACALGGLSAATDLVVRHVLGGGSLSEPWAYQWSHLAPIGAAILALIVAFVAIARGRASPEAPVAPIARRDWLTFTTRGDLIVLALPFAALVATALAAGSVSAPFDDGWYTVIEIPVGDGHGLASFYGWAYGVPALIAACAVIALVAGVLHTSAAQPFQRPDTVDAETASRRATSVVVTRLAAAAVLFSLGWAWDVVAGAGLGGVIAELAGGGEIRVSTGYTAFAPAILVLAFVMQSAAVAMLCFGIRGHRTGARAAATAHETNPEITHPVDA